MLYALCDWVLHYVLAIVNRYPLVGTILQLAFRSWLIAIEFCVMQSHRRHHGPTGSAAQPDTLPTSTSYDDPNKKYHKPVRNKSPAKRLFQIFVVFAVGSFLFGQLFVSELSESSTSEGDGHNKNMLSTQAGARKGTRGSVEHANNLKIQDRQLHVPVKSANINTRAIVDRPDWTLNLQPPPAPSNLPLENPNYGLKQLTGRYRFTDSTGCATKDNFCVAYLPEVDLSEHIVKDEALAVQQQLMQGQMRLRLGGLGGIAGGANQQININSQGNVLNNGKGPILRPKQVMGATVAIDASVDDNHAILTRAGFNGHPNQDRSIIVSPYLLGGSDGAVPSSSSPNDFLMALFDGHGERGQVTSELAVKNYPALLAKKMQSVPMNADGDGFDEAKLREAITAAYKEIDEKSAPVSGAGATATSILRVGNRIYHINTGDSQSFLGYYIKSKKESGVAFITTEHKPHLPEEKSRIEAMGGTVMLPPPAPPGVKLKMSSRVFCLLPNGMQLGLAMSRSIGDPEAGKLGVIPTPDISVLNLLEVRSDIATKAGVDATDVELFAVVASDGIYDHVEPDEAASVLASALYDGGKPPDKDKWSPLLAVEDLIMISSKRWLENLDQAYRDDISLAVSRIIL